MHLKKCVFIVLLVLKLWVCEIGGLHSCSEEYPDCDWETGARQINTYCVRNKFCGPESGCNSIDSNPEFRRWMTEEHNELRNKLASGNDTRGGNSDASGMPVLNYHTGLEFMAKCHILRCDFDHDPCRLLKEFAGGSVGQNLGQSIQIPPLPIPPMTTKEKSTHVLQLFYNEIADTTKEAIDEFPREWSGKIIGHFTQLVADVTYFVGCWRSYDNKGENLLACDYGPTGNVLGRPVYARGTPCSACKNGTKCNANYTSLCGEVDESRYDMPQVARASKDSSIKGALFYLVAALSLYDF